MNSHNEWQQMIHVLWKCHKSTWFVVLDTGQMHDPSDETIAGNPDNFFVCWRNEGKRCAQQVHALPQNRTTKHVQAMLKCKNLSIFDPSKKTLVEQHSLLWASSTWKPSEGPRTEMSSEQKGMSRLVSTLPRKSWFFGLLLCYCTDTRHPLLLWFVALLQTEHIVIERRRYYCNRSILTCFKFAITAGWRKQELTRTQR